MRKQLIAGMYGLAAMIAVSGGVIRAQPVSTPAIELNLPAYGLAGSPMLNVRAGESIAVRPARRGELVPAIFVYDREHRLVAKNDEAGASGAFEWTAASDGEVQVVLYSNSDQPLGYRIEVLPPAPTRAAESQTGSHAVVPVLFATDRRISSRQPLEFDGEPVEGNEASYGACYVSVPRDHRMGALESPSIWRLEFSSDPDRHITVLSKELTERARFFQRVGQLAERSDERDALVFVHGYNTTFDDAARRTAQLAYDLGFKGPAILFSWPSQGTLIGYNRDARNVELSADTLRVFLTDLSRTARVTRIHVIAHSMGNRALVGALTRMSADIPIRQIALLAPDIDAQNFRRLAREFPKTVGPVALYASSRDGALMAAATFAGYPRAGQGGQNIVVTSGVETIDASSVDTSLAGLGHQYFGDASGILSDLFAFFRGSPASKRFGLRQATAKDGPYWIFAPRSR